MMIISYLCKVTLSTRSSPGSARFMLSTLQPLSVVLSLNSNIMDCQLFNRSASVLIKSYQPTFGRRMKSLTGFFLRAAFISFSLSVSTQLTKVAKDTIAFVWRHQKTVECNGCTGQLDTFVQSRMNLGPRVQHTASMLNTQPLSTCHCLGAL